MENWPSGNNKVNKNVIQFDILSYLVLTDKHMLFKVAFLASSWVESREFVRKNTFLRLFTSRNGFPVFMELCSLSKSRSIWCKRKVVKKGWIKHFLEIANCFYTQRKNIYVSQNVFLIHHRFIKWKYLVILELKMY